ncbi:ImmA/IrrE family metallo-endopeptidase [Luteimicrobium sp. NPDC057192]|uniref:ImmA/IrrE family metallo-endopeptidase n=1 Tax=Luteimicrobium sp. NPDC057192 TaxID=3346042 RepID=UPI00363F151C
MYHPWRHLRSLAHVDLIWAPLAGRYGQTDGRSKIVMHPHQLQVERRCTVAHEIVHIELGADEEHVRAETARRLVDIATLVDAWRWSTSLDEIADQCWVTRAVLEDRLAHLTPDEQQWIADAILARDDPA